MADRIYLSPPHLSGSELEMVADAIASNWIAPLGPHVDAFEREFAEVVDVPHAAAVSSGTAAIHLALRLIGIGEGDEVVCPTLTFVATANPILYERAQPVFIDSDPSTWTLDTGLLAEELASRAREGTLPKAVITVDLYGQSADHGEIGRICEEYDIPVIEDAAEALGATYDNQKVGRFGRFGAFSFNGNKIITASTGGMLVSDDADAISRSRFLATQARDPAPHYQHSELGYNYRMSNVVAAIGRAQLRVLSDRVEARRRIFRQYVDLLGDIPGLEFMPEARSGEATRWLTCFTVDPEITGVSTERIRAELERNEIEARPVWKPLHLQPLFAAAKSRINGTAERLFSEGLCVPSGSALQLHEVENVAAIVRSCFSSRV